MSPKSCWLLQEEIIPRLMSAIPQVVNCVGAEDSHELVQDGTAMAAKMLTNVERSKKRVTPGNIAFYTIQHLKSGRRSTGSSISDVYGSQTQLNGRAKLTSLEEVAGNAEESGEEIFLLHDVLSNADAEDPSMTAARKLDWQMFWSRLSKREKAMVQFVAEGRPLRKAARALRCSRLVVKNTKRDLALKLLDFMGSDILAQVQRSPWWKKDLQAIQEKMACREERRR